MTFTTNDEVLTLLEEGYTSSPSNGRTELLCVFDRRAHKGYAKREGSDGLHRLEAWHKYGKYGVYFELKAKCCLFGAHNSIQANLLVGTRAKGSYITRCKKKEYPFDKIDFGNGRAKVVAYSSTKNIRSYKMDSIHDYKREYVRISVYVPPING